MADVVPSEEKHSVDWREKLERLVEDYGCEVVAAEMGAVLGELFPPGYWKQPTLRVGGQVFSLKDVQFTIAPPMLVSAVNEVGRRIVQEVGGFDERPRSSDGSG